MYRLKDARALLAISALLLAAAPAAQGRQGMESRIDSMFAEWDRTTSPGAAVGVMYQGHVAFRKGYGMASLEHDIPITAATVFDTASLAKQFCAYAVLQLVNAEKISLEASVRTYIPELDPIMDDVTVRHLVHHTSGIRDWPGILAIAGYKMEDVITFDAIMAMLRAQRSLNFEPGSQFSYSNSGYNLLAAIVERQSGVSFRAYADSAIFGPLQMTQTMWQDDHELVMRGRATGYMPAGDGFRRVGNNLSAVGSSSLFSSVNDLLRWARSIDPGQSDSSNVASQMNAIGALNDGAAIPYAFGHVIGTLRGLETITQTGSWAGYRSALVRIPEEGFAVIILANTGSMNPIAQAKEIASLFLSHAMERPSPPPPSQQHLWPNQLDQYTGVYDLGDAHIVRVQRAVNELEANDRRLSPAGPDMFEAGDRYTFRRNHDGEVTELVIGRRVGQRHVGYVPSREELASMQGSYRSVDLQADITLQYENEYILLHAARRMPVTLSPALKDIFTSDAWYMPVVRVLRDDAQVVTTISISNSRSRHIRFERL